MRDIVLTLIFAGLLPTVFYRPWFGVLLWCWFSYMNPHRLCWGFAVEMPFAQIIALSTVASMFFHKGGYSIHWTRETKLLVLFVVWVLVTTLDAKYQVWAWPQLIKVYKIQFMTFVTLLLINNKDKLNWTIWVIALSLGFFGVKGGLFTLMTGGGHHVRGPADSFIEGNNEIGLALLMVFPLMNYLRLQSQNWYLKWGMAGAMALTFFAILGTQSRGALVGLVATGLIFFYRSRSKFAIILAAVLILPAGYYFMPDTWHERMATIQTYEEDASAKGRIYAWGQAIRMANEEVFTGFGFEAFRAEIGIDVHSIYFEVLGEHGYVGFALYFLMGLAAFFSARQLVVKSKRLPSAGYLKDLGAMMQVSIVAYASAGAFLGLAYFDFFYHLVAIVIIARGLLDQEMEKATSEIDSKAKGRRFDMNSRLPGRRRVGDIPLANK